MAPVGPVGETPFGVPTARRLGIRELAVVDNPRTPAVASVAGPRPPCGVRPSGSSSGIRLSSRPVSSPSGVRSPGFVVQGSGGPDGRCPPSGVDPSGVQPPGVQPPGVQPVCPDASVPSTSGGGVGDQAGAAGHPAPRARVEVAVGGRNVEQPGRRPRGAWTQTTLPRPRVGQRGRRRTRTGLC
jgi:hypothetical protein